MGCAQCARHTGLRSLWCRVPAEGSLTRQGGVAAARPGHRPLPLFSLLLATMSRPAAPSLLALRRVHLLAECSDATLQRIAARCHWRNVAAKTPVFTRASAGSDVYFLLSGLVRITTYSQQGREVSFRDHAPGEHFGDLSAIDGEQRSADVIALQDSQLLSLGSADFLELLEQEPLLARRMLQHLTQLVRQLTQRVLELSTLGVPARLHVELLRLAQDVQPDGSARIDPMPTHAVLASKISTNREQVARELAALTQQGLLRKAGSRVLHIASLHDLQALAAAATTHAGD